MGATVARVAHQGWRERERAPGETRDERRWSRCGNGGSSPRTRFRGEEPKARIPCGSGLRYFIFTTTYRLV